MQLPEISVLELNKLNKNAIPFNILEHDIFGKKVSYKLKQHREGLTKKYLKIKDTDKELSQKFLFALPSIKVRVLIYLCDNKFKSINDIVEATSLKEVKNYEYKNWFSRFYEIRNRLNFVVDSVKYNNDIYFRIHPPGTDSPFDGARNMNKTVYVLLDKKNNNLPIISFSSLEQAEIYKEKSNKEILIYESNLHNIA